jgi:6-phospho-3-hexuloisomerase
MKEIATILQEMNSVLRQVSDDDIDQAVAALQNHGRIFVCGDGRSGLMGKSFAMRLMHLGATIYVVGETITPSMQAGDLLVAVSGSGFTPNVVMPARKARDLRCTVLAVTADQTSELAAAADIVVRVPAATKYRRKEEAGTVQPLGSLFDQCAHILFDAICLRYASAWKVQHEEAFGRHSNL